MSLDVITTQDGINVLTQGTTTQVTSSAGVDVLSPDEGPQGIPARQDVAFFLQGLLTSSEMLARVICAGSAIYDASHSLASAPAGNGSTGTAIITVTKNGAAFATITFTASTNGVWAFSGSGSVVAGDVLVFTAPASPDATLANVSITLAGA